MHTTKSKWCLDDGGVVTKLLYIPWIFTGYDSQVSPTNVFET